MADPEHEGDGAEDRPADGGGDGGDAGDGDESNLLFSCQCDSARSVGTLLSCLRRVVTAGAPSSYTHVHPPGGTQRGPTQSGPTQSASAGGGATSSGGGRVQHATVYAGPKGLTVHVQHGLARQSQCSVDLPRGLFREYFVGEEEVWVEDDEDENGATLTAGGDGGDGGGRREVIHGGEFGVNLTTVLECFSVLSRSRPSAAGASGGGDASLDRVPLCMSYDRGTATFHLEFLDGGGGPSGGGGGVPSSGGCLVTCEVPGVAVADDVDGADDCDGLEDGSSGLAAAFRSSPLSARAILHSDALAAAVSELYDVPGASVVQVKLEKDGLEMGTVGPRSEAWVTVPYGRGQGGVYVGLEVYDDGGSRDRVISLGLTHTQGGADGVRKYPLGAFLSGMRGLDIGVETCMSLNAEGMMAIQHQVSKEGYHDLEGSGDEPNPSFVDFIMTCIEDIPEDYDARTAAASQTDDDTATLGTLGTLGTTSMSQESDLFSRGGRGRRGGADNVSTRPRQRQRTRNVDDDRRTTIPRRNGRHRGDFDSTQSDEEEEFDATTTGDGITHRNNRQAKSQEEEEADEAARSATARVLGELEVDGDMMTYSSRRGAEDGGRRTALEDIRRRRRERRAEMATTTTENDEGESDGSRGTKRGSDGGGGEPSETRVRRRRGEERSDAEGGKAGRVPGSPSQSEEEEDDDDTDDEELDVTAEWLGGRGEEDRATETRLMYGNTRVEFTQDSD